MRSFIVIACMCLFSMGIGTGFNLAEFHWDRTCEIRTRNEIVDTGYQLFLEQDYGHSLAQLQGLEGCHQPMIDEEIMKAHVAVGLGNLKLAEAYAQGAVDIEPESADALEIRGQIYLRERRYLLALQDLDQAQSLDPALPEVENMRLSILRELGQDVGPRMPASIQDGPVIEM